MTAHIPCCWSCATPWSHGALPHMDLPPRQRNLSIQRRMIRLPKIIFCLSSHVLADSAIRFYQKEVQLTTQKEQSEEVAR